MNKVRIAAVNTNTALGPGCVEINMVNTMKIIDEASANGADIITFPETFPGPWSEPCDEFDAFDEISAKARKVGKYIIYGFAERAEEAPGRHHVVQVLVGPNGKLEGKHCRMCPPGPWIYKGGDFWDFNYIACGSDNLGVFDTDLGKLGLLICSEVFVPELSRILAIKGAEITFLPAGLNKFGLRDNWELLLRARAIENQMYTVSCQNILPEYPPDSGLAVICGPEGELVRSVESGIIYGEANLERVRWLRQAEDTLEAAEAQAYLSKPGLISWWRRPEVYQDILRKYNADSASIR